MIATTTRPGAARLTALVLLSALLRSVLSPISPMVSTLFFIACLAAILLSERYPPPPPSPARGEGDCPERWGRGPAGLLGALTGLALVLPLAAARSPHLDLSGFWTWGLAIAAVATMEEAVLRGPLLSRWTHEAGPVAGVVASALIFAVIHLPSYGVAALPLDFAVGLSLAGLRLVTGRILPCAMAHILADWGAWFWR